MKFSVKFKLFILSGCSVFLLLGCAATVMAPNDYTPGHAVKPEIETIETPVIGETSIAALGDSLVSKQVYKAIKGFTLNEEHIITISGKKREEMRGHCWLSKLPTGFYIARSENPEYIFYSHTPSAASGRDTSINCDSGGVAFFGFAQSKKSKNVYKSWYKQLWNMNEDKVNIDNITISPFVSEKGVFKQEFYYNGKIGSQLKFSYRELTEGGLARDSFSQEVVYDLNDGSIIGFKGAKFKVVDATNTTIKYKVVSHFR